MPAKPERIDVLRDLNFGHRVAEEELKDLAKYFVETEQWRRIYSGAVDIVYGPKGSGKSALYALLLDKTNEFFDRGVVLISGENPRGTPVFSGLVADPPTSQRDFVSLWKLYVLVLIAGILEEYAPENPDTKTLVQALAAAGLLKKGRSLTGILQAAFDYVRRGPKSVSGEIKLDPRTGQPSGVGATITFNEPSAEDSLRGHTSVDSLFQVADKGLASLPLVVWVLLDRLDVAFADSAELEENALRALFQAYLDLLALEQIRLKIFLRTDVWRRLTKHGFREASHITRHVTINWDKPSLINLVVRRALQSPRLIQYCEVDGELVLASTITQNKIIAKLFPDQVDIGPNKPKTFDWVLSRTADGTAENAPRELIHLLNATLNAELRKLDLGSPEGEVETVFSRAALKDGLPEVSKIRLEQTLFAEYPEVRDKLLALQREKTSQSLDSLARVWRMPPAEAAALAEQLVEIGCFQKRGPKEDPEYWVPFLYRPALQMVQGAAD
jgi:hypothetical protein